MTTDYITGPETIKKETEMYVYTDCLTSWVTVLISQDKDEERVS